MQRPWWEHTDLWLRDAAPAVAFAVNSAACLLDLEGVIIDGSFSRELLRATLTAVNHSLDQYSWEGVARPAVLEGAIGSDAPAMERRAAAAVRQRRTRPRPVPQACGVTPGFSRS